MIDIKKVFQNQDAMRKNIADRNMPVDLDAVLALHAQRSEVTQQLERVQAEANQNARDIRSVDAAQRAQMVEQGRRLKDQITELSTRHLAIETDFNEQAGALPNWMSPDVPRGNSDEENLEVSRFMEPTRFDFQPKDHVALGASLDLVDFESGTKVTGPKFYFLKNQAVLLQHALKAFAFRKAMERGFIPLQTPDLARNAILKGVGYAPRGDSSNTYVIEGHDLSLIATAEIAVGGMHSEETLQQSRLPLLYVAESHCFRTEAGAGGRASKGLYRVHQFDKIELFAFTTPEQSEEVHERIRELEESIYQDLEIPYRVVLNCSGDLGAPAYKKYDIEAWMPGKGDAGEYGEVTSASNCTDYQARRLNIKYKNDETGKNEYVHTLNGTATALSRTLIAIMENYQTADGRIMVPKVLQPYLGFAQIQPKTEMTTRAAPQRGLGR